MTLRNSTGVVSQPVPPRAGGLYPKIAGIIIIRSAPAAPAIVSVMLRGIGVAR